MIAVSRTDAAPPMFDIGLMRPVDTKATEFAKVHFRGGLLRERVAALVACHPRAADYLQQAPVLALGFPANSGKYSRYYAALFNAICVRGPRLRTLLEERGIAYPLRRIASNALIWEDASAITALSGVDPRVLGNAIPAARSRQRAWLSHVGKVAAGVRRFTFVQPETLTRAVTWAATNSPTGKREASGADIADFIMASRTPFNPAWGWSRAVEEMNRWHTSLSLEKALRGLPFKPDDEIDLGSHDDAEVGEYEILCLRTPRALCEEGSVMRHCVASYIQQAASGSSRIISVRRNGKRVATAELSKTYTLQQIKGPCNAAVAPAIAEAVRVYAKAVRGAVADMRT